VTTVERFSTSALLRRIQAIPGREMRRAEVQNWFCYGEAEVVVRQLQELLVRCVNGEPAARLAHLAFVDYLLVEGDAAELPINAVDLQAHSAGCELACLMFLDPPPHRSLEGPRKNPELRESMPLGTRIWKASSTDKKIIEKLLLDPSPMVVERLCKNPRVTEAQVVRMGAKRPNWPDVLDTIAKSRWLMASVLVRETLVQNPYVRTGLALTLVPQQSSRVLHTLRYSSDVHTEVKEAARWILEMRAAGQTSQTEQEPAELEPSQSPPAAPDLEQDEDG